MEAKPRMKYVNDRYASPEAAGQRLLELAKSLDLREDGWVYVEKVNLPFLYQDMAKPVEYGAGIKWLIAEGLIKMHDSGCYFTLTDKAKATA